MNIVHGPLGFNDLDREGMLIEGFDEVATFEEHFWKEQTLPVPADWNDKKKSHRTGSAHL